MSPEAPTPTQSADKALQHIRSVHAAAYKLLNTPEQSWIERFVDTPYGRKITQNWVWAERLRLDNESVDGLRKKLIKTDSLFQRLATGNVTAEELADCLELRIKGETLQMRPDDLVSYGSGYTFEQFGNDLKSFLRNRDQQSHDNTYLEAVRILAERVNRARFPTSHKTMEGIATMAPIVNVIMSGTAIGVATTYELAQQTGIIKAPAGSDEYARLTALARAEIRAPKTSPKKRQAAFPPPAAPPATLQHEDTTPTPPHESRGAGIGSVWQNGIVTPFRNWWERVTLRKESPPLSNRGEPTEEKPTELVIDLDTDQRITIYRQGTEYFRPDRDGVEWAGDRIADSLYQRALSIAGLGKTERGHSSPRIVIVETDTTGRVGVCISIHVQDNGRGRSGTLGMTLVTNPNDADMLYRLISTKPDKLFLIMHQVSGGKMFAGTPKTFARSTFITFLPDVKHTDTSASYSRTLASPQLSEGEFSQNVQI